MTSIIKQKLLEKPWFLLFYDFFITFYPLKKEVNVNVGALKVNDEKSRIRIRIQQSEARIHDSGSKMSQIRNTEAMFSKITPSCISVNVWQV